MIKPTCPHCGNTTLKLMEDNGLSSGHSNYTLLCIARVKPVVRTAQRGSGPSQWSLLLRR